MAETNYISKITVNSKTYDVKDEDAVLFSSQSLTTAQKTQARTNIGAGTSSFSGSYNDLTNKPTIPTVPVTSVNSKTGAVSLSASDVGAVPTSRTVNGKALSSNITVGNTSRIYATNKSVATSAWRSNTTYADYPYRASVAVTGMTASHMPEVVFDLTDATSGNLAPIASSYAGGVYIYAKEVPSAAVTIATIEGRATV